METRLISKEALPGLIGRMSQDMPVYAPVKEGDYVLFRAMKRGEEPLTDYANSRNAPKHFLFPQREELMKFIRDGRDLILAGKDMGEGDAVLFGVRPCDARSFALLDMIFDQEKYKDPLYIDKREKTTVIALACVHPPYSTCFCTAVGGSPLSSEGADILITDIGDAYLAEFITPKGERLLPRFGELKKADDDALQLKKEVAERSAGEMKSAPPAKAIKPILDRIFEHPFWDTIHARCLKCGTCTYLCPTCHCFDISDETKGSDGVRIRSWDSCQYPLFTKMASGHNPRTTQKERWRQRIMHKFRYYVDNFGAVSCVGCGRCVMLCPVNIDIRKIITDIAKL
jgi:sulfhydrogenase subunit beta (sulfur reductase)